MSESNRSFLAFTFPAQMADFWQRLRSPFPERRRFLIYLSAFLFLFYFLSAHLSQTGNTTLLLSLLLLFLWIKSNAFILRRFNPPTELLLFIFMIGGFSEWHLLQTACVSASLKSFHYPLLFFHQTNWLMMSWSASLLLSAESNKRATGFIAYIILFFLAHTALFNGISGWRIVLYPLLFLALLHRTTWLERLSRIELGIYLIILFVFYANFNTPDYFINHCRALLPAGSRLFFYSLPVFLFYFGKIYLIVLMIKIPIVLIYNYATISRKLWIASLFQSTFPQIIQFFILLFIFFLFISGWQADNLRQEIYNLGRGIHSPYHSPKLHLRKISTDALFKKIKQPQIYRQDMGISYLFADSSDKEPAFYLYYHPQNVTADSLYLMRVDSAFLHTLYERTPLIIGSGLIAYRFTPPSLLAGLYRMRFWQSGPVRINPLGLIDPFMKQALSDKSILWLKKDANANDRGHSNISRLPFVVGRVFFSTGIKDEYFAIDIFYDISELFQWNFFSQILLILTLFFLFLNTLIIRRMVKFGSEINHLIIRKFAQLRKGVRAIAAGNLDYRVQIYGDDEFSEFADHFNQMSAALKRFMQEAREKERLNQELKIAHQVQLQMLPETLPEIPGYQMAADLTTANEVGGDFYDVFPLNEHRFFMAVGDVSGKGMSAAFYMAQLISLLRYSTKFTTDLKDLTIRLNAYMAHNVLDSNIFVTAILGILDTRRHRFQFVRAGHNLPLLLTPKDGAVQIKEIPCKGLALGLTRDENVFRRHLQVAHISLAPNDTLVLYTDGYSEAVKHVGQKDVFYGEEHFKQQLQTCAELPPMDMIHCLKNDLLNFYEGLPHFDDQTILVLKRK